jgi:hypothetical protein
VAQRLRAGGRHAGVLEPRRDDAVLALRLNARELQLLAEDIGELLERDIDLEEMLPLALSRLAGAVALLRRRERVARIAVALAQRKCGMSMVGTGMVMKSFPFFPIISPFWMYFLRLFLMRPRTMSRKRAWSCLIFSDIADHTPGPGVG